MKLYPVPVHDALPVLLPDGRTAWGRPVEHHIPPAPLPTTREPVLVWAKAAGIFAGSLTLLALGGATALRIAAPALGVAVDILDMIWKVALTLAVILFGAGFLRPGRFRAASSSTPPEDNTAQQPMVFAPQIHTGGTRLLGRSGDVSIQLGDHNHNKQ
ncbi:hypothetical protein [Streptomyces sp. NRRL S-1868]|uniref:hypothetical protein n=1 Tax=Streptomyces sp. NRRL S-1868 TaxID=1463892 RepID=UPI0004C9D5FF|nr:hypothetical protein [Streptomyces sp. NRRL S-1868]